MEKIYLQFNQNIGNNANISLINNILYSWFYYSNITIDGVINHLNRFNIISYDSIYTHFIDVSVYANLNINPAF